MRKAPLRWLALTLLALVVPALVFGSVAGSLPVPSAAASAPRQPAPTPTPAGGADDWALPDNVLALYRVDGCFAGTHDALSITADGHLELKSRSGETWSADLAPDQVDLVRRIVAALNGVTPRPSSPAPDECGYAVYWTPFEQFHRVIQTTDSGLATADPALQHAVAQFEAVRRALRAGAPPPPLQPPPAGGTPPPAATPTTAAMLTGGSHLKLTRPCTVLSVETVADRLGPPTGQPQADVTTDGLGRRCTWQQRRGLLVAEVYAAPDVRADDLIDRLRLDLGLDAEVSRDPLGVEALGRNDTGAALVRSTRDYVLFFWWQFATAGDGAREAHEVLTTFAALATARLAVGLAE